MAQAQQIGKPKVVRVPLLGAYSNRGSSALKDQRFLNIFPETRKVEQLENTKIFLNKRPGLELYKTIGSGEGRGFTYFNDKFYVVVGNTLWEDGVTPTNKATLTASTGPVSITQANSATLGDYLFICDGTSGWIVDKLGAVTLVSSTSIYNVTMITAGAGYGAAPTFTFSGAGGAAATGVVINGAVTSASISNYGTGYGIAPTITVAAPVLTFNPATAVNTGTEVITLTGHTYGTANAVVYNHGGGTVIGGLVNGTTYYIIRIDANTIKLASSAANASAGTAINLTSVGTGTTHKFTGTSTATAECTLNSFPSPHIPSATFIDGYIVLAKGSDVYTCDLDQPSRWSSNNYLSAEMFPDPVKAISRQNNQVCVLGGNSIEFFYDAANASGSPLSRNDSTTIQMGTCAPYAVIGNEKYIFYLSQSDSGGRAAWLVDGFQPKKVSDEYIERILDAEANMDEVKGFGLRTKGHLFYIVNLKSQGRTLVYDSDEKLWHEWSSNVAGTETTFLCDKIADNFSGMSYLLSYSGGKIYKLNPDIYQDDGVAIGLQLVTNKYDMDTYYRKFLSSVKIVGDRYETGNELTLQWTDDDYQTWSNEKTITMTDDFPAFHRLGSFRRRAFKIKHNLNYGLRLESLECVYTEGSS